jgi:hypothetical protein
MSVIKVAFIAFRMEDDLLDDAGASNSSSEPAHSSKDQAGFYKPKSFKALWEL